MSPGKDPGQRVSGMRKGPEEANQLKGRGASEQVSAGPREQEGGSSQRRAGRVRPAAVTQRESWVRLCLPSSKDAM